MAARLGPGGVSESESAAVASTAGRAGDGPGAGQGGLQPGQEPAQPLIRRVGCRLCGGGGGGGGGQAETAPLALEEKHLRTGRRSQSR